MACADNGRRRTSAGMRAAMDVDMINVGTKVIIEKGCKARNITKGATAQITAIQEMGPEYSGSVRVTLYFLNSFMSGKTVSFYARHINRLKDASVVLNDGRPEHKIIVRVKTEDATPTTEEAQDATEASTRPVLRARDTGRFRPHASCAECGRAITRPEIASTKVYCPACGSELV